MTRRSALFAALAIVLLVLCGAWLIVALTTNRHTDEQASTSSSAAIGGPFTLIDTGGNTVTDQTYRGKWMLIYFGYTFCPDACPTALTNMAAALQKLGSAARQFQPLFITVDPKRDTVPAMAEYLKSFDPRIVGLTGSQAQTDKAAEAYRVYVEPQKSDGDDYLVDHSAYIYVMDPRGKFKRALPGDISGDEMADRLLSITTRPGA